MKKIISYVLLTFFLSSIGYYLVINAKALGINPLIAMFYLMWCPALSGIITSQVFEKNLAGIGWRPGRIKWLALGYFLPVSYAALAYGIIWLFGFGAINPDYQFNVFNLIILGTLLNVAFAAGEEIGWRGFLVPQLYKLTGSFTITSLITGIIWSVWHFPLIISGIYLSKMPLTPQLLLLVATVTAMTFPISWLRLISGSVWPAVLFHASHNLYIQRLFDPLTIETNSLSKYMTGESGVVMLVIFIGLAVISWSQKSRLPVSHTAKTKRFNWRCLFLPSGIFLIAFIAALCLSLLSADKKESGATDYSKSEHWLSLPTSPEKRADVFYLYPTSFQKSDENDPNICGIDNPSMLKNSKIVFALQATAFEPVANIYAPYYRQADAKYSLSLPLEEQDKLIGGIPASDALAAFDYYIKNYNNGRPFILAGHSQGSNVMLYLLADYMKEHPGVYERMIAAYVIGYSVTEEYLAKNPHLKFAEGSDDTGVIVSYNTEAPDVVGNNPVLLPGAMVINPITWTQTEEPATAEESLGSLMPDEEGNLITVKNYADARIDKNRGAVICSTADVEKLSPGNPVFGRGVYHMYDYQFYYFNIRENAGKRVDNFFSK